MMKLSKSILAATSLSFSSFAHSALPGAGHIVCPAELPAGAIRAGVAHGGWTPHLKGPFRLESAAPTGGPPELEAELASFNTIHTKTAHIYLRAGKAASARYLDQVLIQPARRHLLAQAAA
jgi:hypothetical protein